MSASGHAATALLSSAPVGRAKPASGGAFVISLDFELHWGVRDIAPLDAEERKRLLQAREMVERILGLFSQYSIHATWATVGLLFASSREEAEMYRPAVRPRYAEAGLDPYGEALGTSEESDPFHFAPSLIQKIAETPGQEIASHSFSHYYCLEAGQTAESFAADLESAISIAESRGSSIRSYVFPRNQINPAYLAILAKHGVECYRGTGTGPYAAVNFKEQRNYRKKAVRLLDTYVDVYGPQSAEWPSQDLPACFLPSRYLAPSRRALRWLDSQKIARIVGQMRAAALEESVFHLWWHPEDFTNGGDANLSVLEQLIENFCQFREKYAMSSLSMADALHVTWADAASRA